MPIPILLWAGVAAAAAAVGYGVKKLTEDDDDRNQNNTEEDDSDKEYDRIRRAEKRKARKKLEKAVALIQDQYKDQVSYDFDVKKIIKYGPPHSKAGTLGAGLGMTINTFHLDGLSSKQIITINKTREMEEYDLKLMSQISRLEEIKDAIKWM